MFVKPSVEEWLKQMLWFHLIEFWSLLQRTRVKSELKRGRVREPGLLFYSCLEDMAHMRPPNPTGNGKPRGKGKTNKGNGLERGGVNGLDGENQRGGASGVQGLCVRWCFAGRGGFSNFCFCAGDKITEWVLVLIRSC